METSELERFMSLDRVTTDELDVITELSKLIPEMHGFDASKATVVRRVDGEWYLELSLSAEDLDNSDHPYDVDVAGVDEFENPIGVVPFFKDGLALSKLHLFRFEGTGPPFVKKGSLTVY